VWLAALYQSVGVEQGGRDASRRQMLKNFELFSAPHVAIVTTDRDLGVYGAVDCGLFVQSFLLAAQARGVATIPQAAIASQAPFIREYFNIPEDRLLLLGISFGYADASHPANSFRTTRRTPEDIVTWAGQGDEKAAVHGRFAGADLASILDHDATGPTASEHGAGEERSLTQHRQLGSARAAAHEL
jgi:hypothetical protein